MDRCHCLSAIEKETQDNQGNNIIGPKPKRENSRYSEVV